MNNNQLIKHLTSKLTEVDELKQRIKELEAENIQYQTKLYDVTKDRDYIETLRSNLQRNLQRKYKYKEYKKRMRAVFL